MTDTTIMLIVGFIASLIAIITPIIKLNTNISQLNTTLKMFQEATEKEHTSIDKRISKHGDQIDELEKTTANHEVRITAVENKGKEK